MSADLKSAQAALVKALLEKRVPDGFDEKGVRATARVLERKRVRSGARSRRWYERLIDLARRSTSR